MSAERGAGERVGIVFLHHRTDEVTRNNLATFREWNPDATIVTMSGGERLPGGYSIDDFPEEAAHWSQRSELQARSSDLLLYAWYRHRREQCERWVVVEWDAFCAMCVEDFFAHVWDFDVVGPNVCWPNREHGWHWFSKVHTLPADLQSCAVGIAPFCFLLVRDAVLAAVSARVPWAQLGEANGELRFGTLVAACGFVPVPNPLAGWNITWIALPETTPLTRGMWHPVKWLAPRVPPAVELAAEAPRVPPYVAARHAPPRADLTRRTRTEIIDWLIARQGYGSYLEIGVGDGAHFAAVHCLEKTGIDPAEGEYAGARPTHRMTSDEFFAQNKGTFDLIFIDGLHHAEVVYRDLVHALGALAPGGMVVCHDLCPTEERMQRVPREAHIWTGDCWKAWVRLRGERPELPMVVAETDMGVGVIFPQGKWRAPVIDVRPEALHWAGFAEHRREWLHLVAPDALHDALFPWPRPRAAMESLSVVTLWRGEWTREQAKLLAWYEQEEFPPETRFLWTTPEGSASEARLTAAWVAREAAGTEHRLELIATGAVPVTSDEMKHHLVAGLYTEALRGLETDLVLFIEDDMLPPPGAVGKILAAFRALPDSAALLAGIYRTRFQPGCICAGDLGGHYLPWPVADERGLVEIGWCGGGFTLYRGAAVQEARPFFAHTQPWIKGWDIHLCTRLRARGGRLYADCGLRVRHQCAPVQRHCAQTGEMEG